MKKNEKYVFDVDKIVNFVFDDSIINNTEITENYGVDETNSTNDLTLMNRIIKDVKNNSDEQFSTIKYDLMKMFISELLTSEGKEFSFGESLIMRTMKDYGFIKIID